jgi:CheY-like chemotaxis protein
MPETTKLPPSRPPATQTILVTEDDANDRESLRLFLQQRGYIVRTAVNGQEALNLLVAGPSPDLILLDLLMPVVDGWEVRRQQLANPSVARIPVVVLTAIGEAEQPDRLGDVGYLHKPIDPDELLAVLERFLAPRRPQVLVVDDEPAMLRLLELVLGHHGFVARLAGGGWQAVELFRQHHSELDAVLLDVQMPGMDGPATLTALQKIDPGVRCIFMSGNTGRYSAEQLLSLGAIRVLPKPFPSIGHVVQVLRDSARQSG